MKTWKDAVFSIIFISFWCLGAISLPWFTAGNDAVKDVAIISIGPANLMALLAVVRSCFQPRNQQPS